MRDLAVLLFSKPAVAGRVKTRLIGALTAPEAAALHAAFFEDLVTRLRDLAADLVVYWALDEGEAIPASPAGGRRQIGGDLGERLLHAFREAAVSHRFAVAIGSDHPDLEAERIEEACAALARGADLVLGPARDGGYYLIAGRPSEIAAELFREIPWSSSVVLRETRARAARLGVNVVELACAEDVDTAEDLERLAARLRRAPGGFCPRTRVVLADVGLATEVPCAS